MINKERFSDRPIDIDLSLDFDLSIEFYKFLKQLKSELVRHLNIQAEEMGIDISLLEAEIGDPYGILFAEDDMTLSKKTIFDGDSNVINIRLQLPDKDSRLYIYTAESYFDGFQLNFSDKEFSNELHPGVHGYDLSKFLFSKEFLQVILRWLDRGELDKEIKELCVEELA